MLQVSPDRFSPEKYIGKALKMDYVDLVLDIDKQITTSVSMQKTNMEDDRRIFIDFLHELRHVFEQGVYPGKDESHKAGIKSIISALVDKGQVNKALLENL